MTDRQRDPPRGRNEDLPAVLGELSTTLDDLRAELGDGPGGVRGLLRFTEEYTIPAMIAVLEANVRLLELLAGAIRLADGRLEDAEVPGPGPRRGDRAATAALDAVDRALTDLSGAVEGTPTDPEARRLLERARELRDEARRRVEGSTGPPPRRSGPSTGRTGGSSGDRSPGDGGGRGAGERPSGGVEIDVEAELDQVRREVEDEDGGGSPGDAESAAGDVPSDDETDGSDRGTDGS